MTLLELFEAVKAENLTKDQLEDYRGEMADLYSKMHLELGQVKGRKALYFGSKEGKHTELERLWGATTDGQREIQLKSYIRATAPKLSELKDRLYQAY